MNKSYEEQYLSILQDVLDNGYEKEGRNGKTLSVFGRTIRHKMSDGFPILTSRKINFNNAVVELLWFLKGNTSIKFLLENNCHIWTGDCYQSYLNFTNTLEEPDYDYLIEDVQENKVRGFTFLEFEQRVLTDDVFCKKFGDVGPLYPYQWRNFSSEEGKIDQIANAIKELKNNPNSRRILVDNWDVSRLNEMVLNPCHTNFQFNARNLTFNERFNYFHRIVSSGGISFNVGQNYEGVSNEQIEQELNWANIPTKALSLKFNMRSTDLPLGLPTNMMVYALLLEIIAKEVNMIPDELIFDGGDVHVYENQIPYVETQFTKPLYQLPILKVKNRKVDDISEYDISDFELINYQHHPFIKIPLSN